MMSSILKIVWQAIKFVGVSAVWGLLSISLIALALNHLYAAGIAGHATGYWHDFLLQIAVLWLGLVCGGVGLAHLSLTNPWYSSLKNIVRLWREFMTQEWGLLAFILSLSYVSLAIMAYVMQKNSGIEAQILLAVTAAALVMFSREMSQQALYAVIKVRADS